MKACAALGCKIQVKPDILMCPKHWFKVPEEIRREVYKEFRRQPGSDKHLEAIRKAIQSLTGEV